MVGLVDLDPPYKALYTLRLGVEEASPAAKSAPAATVTAAAHFAGDSRRRTDATVGKQRLNFVLHRLAVPEHDTVRQHGEDDRLVVVEPAGPLFIGEDFGFMIHGSSLSIDIAVHTGTQAYVL